MLRQIEWCYSDTFHTHYSQVTPVSWVNVSILTTFLLRIMIAQIKCNSVYAEVSSIYSYHVICNKEIRAIDPFYTRSDQNDKEIWLKLWKLSNVLFCLRNVVIWHVFHFFAHVWKDVNMSFFRNWSKCCMNYAKEDVSFRCWISATSDCVTVRFIISLSFFGKNVNVSHF